MMSDDNDINSNNIEIFEDIASLRKWRHQLISGKQSLGFVPTMGCLHEGHLSLAKQASNNCQAIVISIFVNPTQFAPNEDFHNYPRILSEDIKKLSSLTTTVINYNIINNNNNLKVFIPKVEEIYPSGVSLEVDKQKGTFVEVKGKSHQLEGKTRPTFFRGVSTVVTKLFNIVQPDHVYLGQKDAQQCIVIRNMIKDLHFPIEMHIGETVRENDGLAMSSRNKYLSKEMRKVATTLYDALMTVKKAFYDKGIRDRERLLQDAHELIERVRKKVDEDQTLGFKIKLDYLSLVDPETLEEINFVVEVDEGGNGALLSGALYVDTTRLIDNLLLNCKI